MFIKTEPSMRIITTKGNMGNWQDRHIKAIENPTSGFEIGMVGMLNSWIAYANQHKQQYEAPIGDDPIIGDAWEKIGQGLLELLNGETGRLDCGTLQDIIKSTMQGAGVEIEQ